MCVITTELISFWTTPWSRPLRHACVWLVRFGQPLSGNEPDKVAPNWLRPLCLQRWVGQAIAARLAWMREHPLHAAYRYGYESEPCWTSEAWVSYDRRCLRELAEATLLWIFGMEVERLLRIMQESPRLVGNDWTRATLGACEHVAQVYHELRRRHNAVRARYILREELRHYITWQRPDAVPLTLAGPPSLPV